MRLEKSDTEENEELRRHDDEWVCSDDLDVEDVDSWLNSQKDIVFQN